MKKSKDSGIVLISTLFLIVALMGMVVAHFLITDIELATTRATSNSARGFAVAEAGLNVRAEAIRAKFLGYNRPDGVSPLENNACFGGNQGTDDFQCQAFALGSHSASTYVDESPDNPISTTIPPGELYQNLNAQEYRYTVRSTARNSLGRVEAILDLRFKSRLVPLFQFVAFYNKDLEILPGPTMRLSGPIHTNGDLYMNANTRLSVDGQVSTGGDFYRGRKNDSSCKAKPVEVKDPSVYESVEPSCSSRVKIDPSDVLAWNGMIQMDVDELIVPEPDVLDAAPGNSYWDKSDLRLVLHLDGSNNVVTTSSLTGVEIRHTDETVNAAAQAKLDACSGGVGGRVANYSNTFKNNRENKMIHMLEVDMEALFNCIKATNDAGTGGYILGLDASGTGGKLLDDDSEGGLVFHFSVDGPDAAAVNAYGVRLRNGQELRSTVAGAPTIKGLTVVSDQAAYTHGHVNKDNKKPMAILADSFNVLSESWNLDDVASLNSSTDARVANHTTLNFAVMAGTDITGGAEGAAGQSSGNYNGGLENYPRFHEKWSGKTLTYRGSFVSLNTPRKVSGGWVYGNPQYKAPNRDWDYDTDFNDAANLPPMTPRFVYLRQELFVREFEQ